MMNLTAPFRRVASGVVALSCLLAGVGRAQTIDVQQSIRNAGLGSSSHYWAQTFTAVSANSVGAGFNLSSGLSIPFTYDVTVGLYSGTPGAATFLASSQVAVTAPQLNSFQNVDFDAFWSPVGTTPGEVYWLTLYIPTGSAFIGFAFGDVYTGGALYYGDADGITWAPESDPVDLTFRTYTTTVPEPEAFALMALGLSALGVFARRRHRV